jgi:AmmeMemoRadiSam system protein B
LKVRYPTNAGSWYEGDAKLLKKQLEEECYLHSLGPSKIPKLPSDGGMRAILGLLCPHAGYMYSGPIAAHSYAALGNDGKPDTVVILGPNHTGVGSGVSMMTDGIWKTPIGDVPVNADVARAIQASSSYVDIDDKAHLYEHSIELQLPFLRHLFGDAFSIVPIAMMLQDLEVSQDVGAAIGKALKGRNGIVIASSDMSHYEPQGSAEKKDRAAIDAILSLDEEALFDTVNRLGISMCGVGPVAVMLIAAKILGADEASLLKYATSGDITGDRSAVVGYCSIVVKKKSKD